MTRRRIVRILALVALAGLLALLCFSPALGLRLLWDGAVPILPAVFLIQPGLWRSICPLATLNQLPNRWGLGLVLQGRAVAVSGGIGIVLFAVLVPARRFLFNTDPAVLAWTIGGVSVLALLLGLVFDKKAGWCSGICPVLPVERLYGQSPLLRTTGARCHPCTMCTSRGCLDLSQAKAIPQTLGPGRKSHAWLESGFGVFAAGFPGFVLGFQLTRDGGVETAGTVYGIIGTSALASYLLNRTLIQTLNLGSALSMRLLAGLSIGLYYWFSAATLTSHLELPVWSTGMIRALAFGLLGAWFWRANQAHSSR